MSDRVPPDDAVVALRVGGQDALLEELSRRASRATGLDAERIREALRCREALGSTGIGGGLALPHARLPGLARSFVLVASLRNAIPYEAVDDRPVDLVVLLLLPEDAGPAALAGVARRLREPGAAAAMRAARDPAQLALAFAGPAPVRPLPG
ncbi:PTS sugar transporter subunit IIA [Methylobacterium sp. JK268]